MAKLLGQEEKKVKMRDESDEENYPDLFDSSDDDQKVPNQVDLGMGRLGQLKTGAQWLKLPDPAVSKQDAPIKAMMIMDDVVVTGNDKGQIILYDKASFDIILKETIMEFQVLNLQR